MSKGADRAHQARLERRAAGFDISLRNDGTPQLTKAELRASIPVYDESIVKRIEAAPKGKKNITRR